MTTKPTAHERINVLEAKVVTLQLQMRAMLQSQKAGAENTQHLTEVIADQMETITDLSTKLRQALIRQAAQAVIDGIDANGYPEVASE